MDPEEARLEEEVRRCRTELVAKGESLGRTMVEKFDPREMVKRNPFGSLLTLLGVGIFAGKLVTGRGSRARNGETESKPSGESVLASLAMGVLPGLLPRILPMVVAPLLSFFKSSSGTSDHAGADGAPAHSRAKKRPSTKPIP